ncbi:TIGR00725 family protein [Advenella alkanexedens]|uniref:TIGR00725 family protein n=1 Tax=Advenella alkanexedens TaxID=1481665 RepID=UPI002675DDA4|nr:TIGR00725 family protein [Advenella alkanexedens]WKU19873.1 TIGR00725 family protein [Advenella alkanexedens]
MNRTLLWSEKRQILFHYPNFQFDPWQWKWHAINETLAEDAREVDAIEALKLLQPRLRKVPIAVIGPREATEEEYQYACQLGKAMAEAGLQLLCGGKNGVMEAVAKGHLEAGGMPIGLIPETEWTQANPYISIPIATGIGKSRNVIIAQACPVLIAIGGGYGTMSEMAFGLHFDKLILTLGNAPVLPGAIACSDIDDIISRTAAYLLRCDHPK